MNHTPGSVDPHRLDATLRCDAMPCDAKRSEAKICDANWQAGSAPVRSCTVDALLAGWLAGWLAVDE